MSEERQWETVEDAIAELKEHRDDFDAIVLAIRSGPFVAGRHRGEGAFVEIQYCSGKKSLISLEIAEQLMNDGILSALRIPFRLRPAHD